MLEAVGPEGACLESNCLFPGSPLLKFIAPLNTATVQLLRKPWGWTSAGEPGDPEPRQAWGLLLGQPQAERSMPLPPLLPAPIVQAVPLFGRRLWRPAQAEKLGSYLCSKGEEEALGRSICLERMGAARHSLKERGGALSQLSSTV